MTARQADFLAPFDVPPSDDTKTLVAFFPGGTIGQCDDHGVVTLMANRFGRHDQPGRA